MLQITPLLKISSWDIIIKNYFKPVTCNHLLNHILVSMSHNLLDFSLILQQSFMYIHTTFFFQSHVYCRALTKRSISQNFQNVFFCIIHISLTFSILCQKILAENRLQSSFLGSIKTLYPIFRVGFDNQNTLSNVRVYNTSNLADNLYF